LASNAKVGIQFIAEASSVTKVTDDVKRKLDELGSKKVRVAPEIDFNKARTDAAAKSLLPKFDPADLVKANQALGDLQKKIQSVGTSTNAVDRVNGIRDSVFALQKFRFEQAALLKESPELRSAYSQVAGQVSIAAKEAQRFAQAQAQAAAEARKLAAVRPANVKAADSQLDGFRDRLNKLNFAPNLGQAAKGYEEILVQLRAWESTNKSLIASNSDLAARVQTFRQSAIQGLGDIAQRFQGLAGVAASVAAAFAGVGTLFGGLAAGALTVAGTFEQLQARLVSVTGSAAAAAEKFTFVQKLALQSPFDVRGLVQGATILEGYQQRVEDFLPVAGNLAAAMGKSLPEATLVFAKAASGSSEGFESLRNEYAITTRDLLKYGAVQGHVVGQLSHAEDAIEKNRDALVKLISVRYGDAMERQSKTLQGALSNVGDAADTVGASFGKNLIPIATLGAKALTGLLNVANLIPAPMKAIGIAGAVAVGGLLGLGALGLGAVASLLLLQAALANTVSQLAAVGVTAPRTAAALQALSLKTTQVAGAMTASRLASVAFGVGLLSLAAVAATAGLALADSWEKAAVQMGEQITKSSREMADANQFFRRGISAINEAGKSVGVTVQIVGNSAEQMRQINNAFASIPKDQIVTALLDIGVTSESLTQTLNKNQRAAKEAKERLEALIDARRRLNETSGIFDPGSRQGSEARLNEVNAQLAPSGLSIKDSEDLDQQITQATELANQFSRSREFAANAKKTFDDVVKPLVEATTASKQLSEFLNLSKQVGTTEALSNALALVNQRIRDNSEKTRIATEDVDVLLKRLEDPKLNATDKAGLEAQLTLIQQRTGILEQQAADAEKAAKAEIDTQERAFRRKKALGEATLQDELYFVRQRIQASQKGTEEEVSLQERAAQLKEQIRNSELSKAKEALQKEAEAGRTAVQDAQAGLGGQTVLAALEQSRAGVERWAKENAGLLKQFPELQAELDKLRSNNALDAQKAKAQGLKDALATMVQGLETSIAEATGNEAKLQAVGGAIATIQRARAGGLVDAKDAQAKIVDLTKQQLNLEKEVSREKQQQAITLAQADLSNLDQNVQLLQADTENAARNEAAITALREEGHQRRLSLIEQEKQAAFAGGQSRVFTEAEANRKIQAEEARFSLEKLQVAAERKQRDLQNAQAVEAAGLSVLESEASVLEQRKQLGENVERQISENLRQQIQERVNLIELEKQQAIASGQDRVTAETAAQAKLAVLANQEKARMLKDLQEKQGIRSRVFGANSPVYSEGSEGLGISLGDFRLGDLTKTGSLPRPKARNPQFSGRLEPVGKPGGGDSSGGGQGQGGSQGQAQQPRSLENWTLNFQGLSLFGPEFENAVLTIVRKAWSEARNRAG